MSPSAGPECGSRSPSGTTGGHMERQEKDDVPNLSPERGPTHPECMAVPPHPVPHRPLSKVASSSSILGAEGGSFSTLASQHPFPCPNFPDQLRLFFRGSGDFLFQCPSYPHGDAQAQARSFKGSLQQNRCWPLPCACPPLSVSPSPSPRPVPVPVASSPLKGVLCFCPLM